MDLSSIKNLFEFGFPITHTLGLFGNHGVGKTSFVKNNLREIVARKHNVPLDRVHVITRCVSVMDPADLIGNFHEFGGRTYSCPPSWIPTSREYDDEMEKLYEENDMHYTRLTKYDDYYILFMDECKRGNSIIQDAIMEMLLEHTLFGVAFHKNTYVVCADNDNMAIYNGTKRDPAQESRIKSYTFAPTNKEYLSDYQRRVDDGKIHGVIYDFLSKYPDYIVLPSKTIEELNSKGKKGPSPRDWTQLGECLQQFVDNGRDVTDGSFAFNLTELAAGYVGSYASKFADYCTTERATNIDANTVLNNMSKSVAARVKKQFKTNASIAVPICNSIVEQIKKIGTLNADQGKNLLMFIEACPNEAIAALTKSWMAEAKDSFMEWRCTPRRYKVLNAAILNTKVEGDQGSKFDKWVESFCKHNNIRPDDLDSDEITLKKVG